MPIISRLQQKFARLKSSKTSPQSFSVISRPIIDDADEDSAEMASSAGQRKPNQYPEPFIVQPKSGRHVQSFIVLHGRGSNGESFGRMLLETPVPEFETLEDAFPNAKFVFPTAAKRRAQALNRAKINQWFDLWSIKEQTEREELHFDGLRQSTEFIHGLLRTEIEKVGAENVVVWGLSQGCAVSLVANLLWQGEKVGAVLGMCGWLPLRRRMEDAMLKGDMDDEDDLFSREDGAIDEIVEDRPNVNKVVGYLREELQMPSQDNSSTALRIPVFLGHGKRDEKVPLVLGQEAADLLRRLDVHVEYKEYDRLAHWYSSEMLRDMILFIERKVGWPIKMSQEVLM